MDHRGFIKSLNSEQRQALTGKSDAVAFRYLALHWGLIAVVGWLITERVWLWPLLMVVQGVLIIFLFTLLHETIHRTAFATRSLNNLVARICGLVILLPPDWFRYFHYAHHRFTQDPDRDPELMTAKPETTIEYLKHLTGVPVWIGQVSTLWQNARGVCYDRFVPPDASVALRTEARWMLAIYTALVVISLMIGSTLLLTVWIIPMLLGQPWLRLYLLAEHARCATVQNMFANTRTTLTSSVVRVLAWQMPYHTEHHTYPNVPFFRLAELHVLMKGYLQETETGYMTFNRKYLTALSNSGK